MSTLKTRGKKEIYWIYWYDPKLGGSRSKSLHTVDKTEAKERQIKEDYSRSLGDRVNERTSWQKFRAEYVTYAEAAKRPNSVECDETALNVFEKIIKPVNVSKIDQRDAERFKALRLTFRLPRPGQDEKTMPKTVSKATFNVNRSALHAAFEKAREWRYIGRNPFEFVPPYDLPEKSKRKAFTPKETADIIAQAEKEDHPDLYDMVMVFFYTGVRISEIRHLIWPYIDLERQTYKVEGWDIEGVGKFVPKKCYLRENPIEPALLPVLRKRLKLRGESPLVFPSPTGKVREERALQELFKRFFQRCGVDGTPHLCRHTYCTRQAETPGMTPAVLCKIVGHSTVEMTMRYFSADLDHKRTTVGRMKLTV